MKRILYLIFSTLCWFVSLTTLAFATPAHNNLFQDGRPNVIGFIVLGIALLIGYMRTRSK